MSKKIFGIILGILSLMILAKPSFAHVVVSPKQVGIGAYQEFTISVPTEKEIPTVELKLMIPESINGEVVPNVKPGWTINLVKQGDKVKEIDWTGGSIPAGQRDNFLFQVQVPATETTLQWKAIQTYQDGSTVEWTHGPSQNPDDDSNPPYSTTKVINDLNTKPTQPTLETENNSKLPLLFSLVAIGISVASFVASSRRK